MNILAIETSCDETAAAVVADGVSIVSNVVMSSREMHEKWGGVVPEVAARHQLSSIIPVVTQALEPLPGGNILEKIGGSIDAIAVTAGPGLIGSLLVGTETAKTLAYRAGKPLIPINHVHAHIYANFIDGNNDSPIVFPAIALVVSGGHTELYLMNDRSSLIWLGGTIDDAAGEAFDKVARMLGFGHGGGQAIEKAASLHTPLPSDGRLLPRPLAGSRDPNFSFSGLKTAVMREWKKLPSHDERAQSHMAYETEEAITDVLVKKTIEAVTSQDAASVMVAGGVASNTTLRKKLETASAKLNVSFHAPPPHLCTDNAASIGSCAFYRNHPVGWESLKADPGLSAETASPAASNFS